MNNKKRVKRTDARRVRIGANRKEAIERLRAQRLRAIMSAFKKWSKVAAVVAVVVAAGYVMYLYSPAAFAGISDSIRSTKRLSSNIKITNCNPQLQARLMYKFDSLKKSDSLAFDRATILKIAAMFPEIEKASVKKSRNKVGKEALTQIKIVERKPVALVHDGNIFLVDKKGVRFAAKPGQYYDLPLFVVCSKITRDTVDLEFFNLIQKISRRYGDGFFSQISQIDISDGSFARFYFKTGEAEYIIDRKETEKRLIHIKRLRERILADYVVPMRVDLRYRGAAFASVR
ncbi:MAG: hypothetical protein LBU70_07265 [Chitinispirillales bacterium]|jgi:cell division septal protein FtsQ|nr:hypothetical protein [Chitinispirillales bacterium]